MKPLELLDDRREELEKENIRRWHELAESIRKSHLKPAQPQGPSNVSRVVASAARNMPAKTQAPANKTLRPSQRIFRDRPTLRQMMAEYNGRGTTLSPLKANAQNTRPSGSGPFRSQQIESYEIPGVSARILRPSRG